MEIDSLLMKRVALMHALDLSKEEIHAALLKEGLTEEQTFLAYCAGKVLFDSARRDRADEGIWPEPPCGV